MVTAFAMCLDGHVIEIWINWEVEHFEQKRVIHVGIEVGFDYTWKDLKQNRDVQGDNEGTLCCRKEQDFQSGCIIAFPESF